MKNPATGIDADEEYLIALHCARLMTEVADYGTGLGANWSNMSGWPAYLVMRYPGTDVWLCQVQPAAFEPYTTQHIPFNEPEALAKFLLELPNFNARTHVSKLTEWAARNLMS
jgi:hypothetical protein